MESNSNVCHECISIGMKAPDFEAYSTFGPVKMSNFAGRWLVFFSHPGDFTPVCTTEFLAFARIYPSFQAINTELLGLSVDSNSSHLAWVYSIYQANDIEIPFPVVADRVGTIANLYGMFPSDPNTQATVRNVYVIDPTQIIRAIISYPYNVGRNINEIHRLVVALQTAEANNAMTPANWTPNNPVLLPAPTTYQELLERVNNPDNLDISCVDWYWCYKRIPDTY